MQHRASILGNVRNLPALTGLHGAQQRNKSIMNVNVIKIYEGSKFFWRCRMNADISMVYHPASDCIEVIPFNTESWEECERIYVCASAVFSRVEAAAVSKVEATVYEYEQSRHKKSALLTSMLHSLAAEFIMSRVVVEIINSQPKFMLQLMDVDAVSFDKPCDTIVLEERPPSLVNTVIQRQKRKTNLSDFQSTLDGLKMDATALNTACNRAEKLVNVAQLSVNEFSRLSTLSPKGEAGPRRRSTYDPDNTSTARKRWHLAARRVIHQNSVNKARALLLRRSLDAIPKSPSNTNKSPVATVTFVKRPIITNSQSLPPVHDAKAPATTRAPAKASGKDAVKATGRRPRNAVALPRTTSSIVA